MLWWLAETTVLAAALAGAVALVCRRLRPRPAVRHALWLVVLLKLLSPPLFAWPWPALAVAPADAEPVGESAARPPPDEAPAEPPAEDVAPAVPPEAFVAPPPLVVEGPAPEAVPEPAPVEEPAPAAVGPPPAEPAPRLPDWLPAGVLALWQGGAVLMAAVQLVRLVRFQRRVARGGPAPEALLAVVRDMASCVGGRAPAVCVLSDLASPVVWGLGRPMLLWPAALLGRLSADSERAAVAHELAHLRRRDHWVGWLQLVASCVWWWNPLFWHVRRQLGSAAELACDARVVELLPKARRAYAEALLEVCEVVSRRAAPEPALGMGGARLELERRLTMILRDKVPSRLPVRGLFGVVLLALIALPGWTLGQRAADTKPVAESKPAADPNVRREAVPPPPAAQPAARPAADEREQRLQKLEANLEALLREVKDLRGAAGKPVDPIRPPAVDTTRDGKPHTPYYVPVTDGAGRTYYRLDVLNNNSTTRGAEQPVRLERVTYTLPKDKADALAAALKDVKAPVLETQVKADGLVVTTTPEVQRVIGDFVGLLQGKAPAPKAGNAAPPNAPAVR